MNILWIKIIISVLALLIAAIHLIWPNLSIDAVTFGLFITAIVPWLSSVFRSLEFPGGFKVEFQDLEKIRKEAAKAGMLAEPPATQFAFETVSESDPNLALAGLRIELENKLAGLAEAHNLNVRNRGIRQYLRLLGDAEVLTKEQRSVISDLTPMLNSAVHGAVIDKSTAMWAIEVGPQILASLESRM